MKRVCYRTIWTAAVVLAAASPLRADLVGWWTFDGDVEDHSGMENHGELIDAVYDNNVPSVIGSGQSLSFEFDTDHVLIEEDPSLDSDVFTLSMFIFDRGQAGAMERLTSRERDRFETAINVHGPFNGMGELSYYSPGIGWRWGDYIPAPETWVHVAYVSDGAEISIYADGELVVGPNPFSVAPSGFMHIGNRWNDVEGFDGLIDDVALWDEVLSDSVIAELAAGTRRPGGPTVVVDPGDFDRDGDLDAADIDALTAAVIAGNHPAAFDLNNDGLVNNTDRDVWVVNLKRTWFGDANLDGEFNSTDFVQVFQQGEYEDLIAGNSTWAEGDWSGDGEFNSTDFVVAFQDGGFEKGPRAAAAAAVPEPNGLITVLLGTLALAAVRAKRAS